ncbi:MAG: hypothetical protein ACOYB1_05560 [Limnohabitans sp.]
MNEYPPARLHAIIAVDAAHAVRCQHAGCGHKVYAAVHIVQEAGKFLILGSQELLPWPTFAGWELALPAEIGDPDPEVQGYAIKNIVHAMRLLGSINALRRSDHSPGKPHQDYISKKALQGW